MGRESELAQCEAALTDVVAGAGRLAFVVGEMGVGKTRLAEEVLDLARERGCNVLVGRTGQANSGPAYAPFLSAFGTFLRRLPPVQREALLDGLAHLGRLWPDLGPPPPPLSDPELDRTLLFESVARLLERVTADTPAVVLLDDLHWADGGSLALLSYPPATVTPEPRSQANHCRCAWSRFLGSVPNNVSHHAACAVLIVHTG